MLKLRLVYPVCQNNTSLILRFVACKNGKNAISLISVTIELRAGSDDAGRRLDRVLRKALPDYSLSLIHRLLRQGKARLLVDGQKSEKRAKPGYRVGCNDIIQIVIQDSAPPPPPSTASKAAFATLPEILWRGSGIIVFNKPPGLATHGKASLDTLVSAWLDGKLPPSLSFKPGPLHRLDKPTSGLIAFSETLEGARLFSRLLRERQLVKTYLAIVEGRLSGEKTWQDRLVRDKTAQKTFARDSAAAKDALTRVKALVSDKSYTLIEARILTGRTHQIRSQAASHGHPLAGDTKYDSHEKNASKSGGFFLHAWKMEQKGAEGIPPLIAPLPELFLSRISELFGHNIGSIFHTKAQRH
jgi:23S rRNA pseudouridine955/2504/2580 synthase